MPSERNWRDFIVVILEQKEANTHKRSRWQEIIKLRAEVKRIQIKRAIKESMKQKSLFFKKKINQIDKVLFKLMKRQRISKLNQK